MNGTGRVRRRLSMEARRELTEAVRERYRSAGRTEKKRILDEFAELAGYHRKYAIRVLGNGNGTQASSQQPKRRIYKEAVITALTILWEVIQSPINCKFASYHVAQQHVDCTSRPGQIQVSGFGVY